MRLDTSIPISSVMYNGVEVPLVGAASSNKKLSELTEGSLVSILEDGKLVPFYVAKHDYEADLNGEGRTLLVRKDLLSKRAMNSSNVNTYANSTMDTWLNNDYKALLSSEVLANIGLTGFKYTIGNGTNTVTTLQRAVFLLSVTEVGATYAYANTEGSALPIASVLRLAYLNGVVSEWWARTPSTSSTSKYVNIYTNDVELNMTDATATSCATRPCFTLPATMALNDEPYADGSWGLADEDVLFDTETAKTTPLAPVNYTNGIADLTPAQLDEIAAAISANPNITNETSVVYYDSGDVHRKISVGDTQDTVVVGQTMAVNIIGFNHDDLSLGTEYGNPTATGKAGMTFQLVDCRENAAMHTLASNAVGWTSCNMRNGYMPSYYQNLPTELQSVIKGVNKLTSAGNTSSTINTTEDKLFLLSSIEIFGSPDYAVAGEGLQYAYYKAGNTKVKKLNSTATNWWGRSPYPGNSTSFACVLSGGASSASNANTSLGVAFAYCI